MISTTSPLNNRSDLDTVACSIAYAWIRSQTQNSPTIPIIQTNRSDIGLRAENLHALELAGLQPNAPELLCLDELSWTGAFPSNSFALVDHNRLLPQFENGNSGVKIVAVVDHHVDEGFYKDADTRVVNPAGSCASHVANLCPEDIPTELASLLLSAIVIDTSGLKAGGKALQVDREAAALLVPKTHLSSSLVPGSMPNPDNVADLQPVRELTKVLSDKKNSVSHLKTGDLLRRDYKQYVLELPWAYVGASINAGLSTVPVDLRSLIPRDSKKFWSSIKQWMEERKLSVLGVLTSFRGEKTLGNFGKAKHKRQMLWVVRDAAEETSVKTGDVSAQASESSVKLDIGALASRLWGGLEASEDLKVEKQKLEKFGTSSEEADTSMVVRVYKQGNSDATRKVTAPLMKKIIESPTDSTKEGQLKL